MVATTKSVRVRQLAKTLNDKVGKMVVAYNIPGPLVRELEKMTDDPIPAEDRPYCNEIFSQNPDAPEYMGCVATNWWPKATHKKPSSRKRRANGLLRNQLVAEGHP